MGSLRGTRRRVVGCSGVIGLKTRPPEVAGATPLLLKKGAILELHHALAGRKEWHMSQVGRVFSEGRRGNGVRGGE